MGDESQSEDRRNLIEKFVASLQVEGGAPEAVPESLEEIIAVLWESLKNIDAAELTAIFAAAKVLWSATGLFPRLRALSALIRVIQEAVKD